MNICMQGHTFLYALEQSLLTYFPATRPHVVDTPAEAEVVSVLHKGAKWATATTELRMDGKVIKATSRMTYHRATTYEENRWLTHCVKLSVYKAAKELAGVHPPWGSLTGIRPAKLVSLLMDEGRTLAQATNELRNRYDVTPARVALASKVASASFALQRTLKPRDIALYVGIPFCPTRCAYCSFVSSDVAKSGHLMAPYMAQLHVEMTKTAATIQQLGLTITSVYIGGGTPTSLPIDLFTQLLTSLQATFSLQDLQEYTVEAGRPDTITPEKLAVMRSVGVNRVSINPQTMFEPTLARIGRAHSIAQTLQAYEQAVKAGFSCINMDIIAGLPEETARHFADTVQQLMTLKPQNLTVHTLSRKKGSSLATQTPEDTTDVTAMVEHSLIELPKHGYEPYYLYRQKQMSGNFENTGWCQAGQAGHYNLVIMEELQTILSLGAGGVTKLVHPPSGRIERLFQVKYPTEYLSSSDKIDKNQQDVIEFYQNFT